MSIILFIFISIALLIFFSTSSAEMLGLSAAEVTIDNIRFKAIQQLNSQGRAAKLKNLNKDAVEFLKKSLLVCIGGGLLLTLLMLQPLGIYSAVFFLIALACVVIVAEASINHEYKKWQSDMVLGLPALVDFLPAFLETPSITTREALRNVIPFLSEPLRGEMERCVSAIERTGKAAQELLGLSSRVRDPVMEAVCTRLATTWDTTITPNLFQDLREEMVIVQEMAIAKSISKKKGLFVLVALVGITGLGILAGIPVFINIFKSASAGFGG